MLIRLLILLGSIITAAVVTVASAAQMAGVNGPQSVYSANNGGDGGP